MQLDVSPILKGESQVLEFEYRQNEFPDIPDVTFPGDCTVSGNVDNRAGYITLSLTGRLPFRTVCARCLADISDVFEISTEMPLAAEGSLQNDDTEDYVMICDNKVDIGQIVEEYIILEFPSRFLCREDCAGICQTCGKNLNTGKCDCNKKEIDPRLEILSKLLDK